MKYKNKIQTARQKYLEGLTLSEQEQNLIEKDFSGNDFSFFLSENKNFILPNKYSQEATYTLIEKQIKEKSHTRLKPFVRYASIAAAILIIALFSTVIYNTISPDSEIIYASTSYGEKKEVSLPDGSTVILNSLSSISYPKEMQGDTRDVTLKGEAYFDVAKNPDKAFIVKADGIEVKVLGTKFNINAYENQETITTSLFEGLVSVGTNSRDSILLKPGQQTIFNRRTQDFRTEELGQQEKLLAWRNNTLIFDNEQLSDILDAISREKDVTFVINDKQLRKLHVTARFKSDESIDNMLQVLGKSAQFTYTKERNIYTIKKRK